MDIESTEYFDQIQKVLSKILNIKTDKIKSSSDIALDLGADSLDMIEIIMSIENEFGCYIPDDQVEKIEKVIDLEKAVKRNILI